MYTHSSIVKITTKMHRKPQESHESHIWRAVSRSQLFEQELRELLEIDSNCGTQYHGKPVRYPKVALTCISRVVVIGAVRDGRPQAASSYKPDY